jgi:outer membrane protein, adhesin transport system
MARVFGVFGFVLASLALTQTPHVCRAETLVHAVQTTLRNNPEIQALKADVEASGFDLVASEGLRKPKLAATANVSATTADSDGQWSAGLVASQSLFDGGFASGELKRASAERKAAFARLKEQLVVTTLQVARAYMEVQRTRALVRILDGNLKSLRSLQHRVKLRVEAGVSNEVELYDTASKIDAAKVNTIDAQNELADAIASYHALVGKLPGRLETIEAPTQWMPRSATEAAKLAQSYSPRVMAIKYDAISVDGRTESTASASKPKLDLSIQAEHTNYFDGKFRDVSDLTAQINFRFDLYDGGVNAARVKQSEYTAQATRDRAKAEAKDVQLDVITALNAVRVAGKKVMTLKSQLSNIRRTFELSRKRYNAGVTPLSDLLDLHNALANAEASWLNAEFAHRYNVYRVLAGTGRLPKSLNPKTAHLH